MGNGRGVDFGWFWASFLGGISTKSSKCFFHGSWLSQLVCGMKSNLMFLEVIKLGDVSMSPSNKVVKVLRDPLGLDK